MKKGIVTVATLLFFCVAWSQRVVYSEPDKNDLRQTNFEIIGKVNGNILIYKNLRDVHAISVYDMEMKQTDRIKLTFLPDRIINADFLAYPDYCYMFYQYQRKNVVYSMAVKFDGNGKKLGDPIQMDTTEINFWASNKIYSVINSEDKQRIGVFKINTKNDRRHLLTTLLFTKDLQLLQKKYINIEMPERVDFLTEFQLDNEGTFVFARAVQTQQNDNIQKLSLLVSQADSVPFTETPVNFSNHFLDDIRIKVNNYNGHYLVTSFYSKTRVGNIEGIFNAVYDKRNQTVKSSSIVFNDNLRNEAKGENSTRSAFNDYFLKNVIVKKDGGFLIAAESFYSTSRGGGFNRYDYLGGSSFMRPLDYYTFGPLGYGYPFSRYNNLGPSTRYYAQNIAMFAFDSSGRQSWYNIIAKTQYDDESDALIGYQLVNTGDQLHFIYNQQEKRLSLLSDQSIDPSGKLTRNPTFKNLDKGYDFLPRYGKQIGARQIIFPCMYRNYLCFARLDL